MLALLWLLIALMPLRALSQELMGAAQRTGTAPALPMAAMPCHATTAWHVSVETPAAHPTAVATDAMADPADGAGSDQPAPNCSACGLCHAALAGPMTSTPDLRLPVARERTATPPGPSAAVPLGGIFKPPRG
jgi:hypothetical protein